MDDAEHALLESRKQYYNLQFKIIELKKQHIKIQQLLLESMELINKIKSGGLLFHVIFWFNSKRGND